MVPCAYLRAFEPLDAFPAVEREWWGSYVAAGAGITVGEAAAAEDRSARTRLLTGRGPLYGDVALVRRVGNRIHLCPLQLDLRAATAMRSFLRTLPTEVVDAFVPDLDERATYDVLGRADRPPHIRDTAWVVPLPWFVLFEPSERHLVDPPEGRGPRLTYLTTAASAAERLERTITVVEDVLEDGEAVLAELVDLSDWVESFHEESLLELDYGRVAGLFDRPELDQDRTCEDLWNAIECLEDGDLMAATAYYGVARSRWTTLRHKQYAS